MFGRKKPFRAVFTCISPILYNISYIIYHTYFKPRARGEKKNRSIHRSLNMPFLADFCLHAACICLSLLRQFMQTTWIFSGPLTNLQLSIPLPYSTSTVQHQHLTSVSQLDMATRSQSTQLAAISSSSSAAPGRWTVPLCSSTGTSPGQSTGAPTSVSGSGSGGGASSRPRRAGAKLWKSSSTRVTARIWFVLSHAPSKPVLSQQ